MTSPSQRFERRKLRTRSLISSVSKGKIRLSVHKSNSYVYAQVIDDSRSVTLASASSLEKDFRKIGLSNCNIESASLVGSRIADRALAAGVESVVFDRGGNKYHGVIKALADTAREKLKF